MSKWWETTMSDAGQALYSDPQLALEIATMPDKMMTSQENYQKTMKATQEEKSGIWNSILEFGGKVDGALENLPVAGAHYKAVKNYVAPAMWYPVDKAAQGARWLYSEGFSQPFSATLLHLAREDLDENYSYMSWDNWKENYDKAENISPGQAFMNYENVIAAKEDYGFFSSALGLAEAPDLVSHIFTGDNWKYTGPLSEEERKQVKRQTERFLYDTEYWRKSDKETYNVGSGGLDFFFLFTADPAIPIINAAAGAVKGLRSVQFADDAAGEMVRDRGKLLNAATKVGAGPKRENVNEFAMGTRANKFYDWIEAPGLVGQRKSAAEIASHPIWGRGRRKNPFTDQWGQVLASMPRDDMPRVLRFALGDTRAATEMAAKGGSTLDKIGRLSENRVFLDSLKFDDDMLSYFLTKKQDPSLLTARPSGSLYEPPRARPAAAGKAQKAWDKRYGGLSQRAEVYEGAAGALAATRLTVRASRPVGAIDARDLKLATQWKTQQADLIQNEVGLLQVENKPFGEMLGANLGRKAEDLEASQMHMFGTMDRAYRMGGLTTNPARKAEANAIRALSDRKGRFATQGFRQGFYGTPMKFIQSFGDRVPEGRINHNEDDAAQRVLDMLKQVPALETANRARLLDRYLSAGDKVQRLRALETIHADVITHMASRVHGLDPELAQALDEMVKVGVGKTMSKLTGGNHTPTSQAFSAATREGAAKPVDHIEIDGAWIVAPQAKTQLNMTDTLLPVKEINEILSRNSGALKQLRKAGASTSDTLETYVDSFNTIWKAATLLRPAYTPRMVSEEVFASAIKFGILSRLIADPAIGAKNFIRNRAVQGVAELGYASHVPTTGKAAESSLAIVRLEDEALSGTIEARRVQIADQLKVATGSEKARLQAELSQFKTKRIRVNKALPLVNSRIGMEKELADNLRKDVERAQREIAKLSSSQLVRDQLKIQALQDDIIRFNDEIAEHQDVMDEFIQYSDEILRVAAASTGARLGEGTFTAHGREVPQAFSAAWENSIPRSQVSSDNAYQTMFARAEAIDTARAIRTGSWTYITKDQPNFMPSWLRALNYQWRQDDVYRLVAEDATGKKAMDWLKTADGKSHLRDLGGYRSAETLVSDVKFTLDKYLPVEKLQAKLAKGDEVTEAELRANIPENEFPIVHGEEIKYATARGHKQTAASVTDRIVSKGFKRLGSIPSDLMSRHPVYARAFEARYRTILGQELKLRESQGVGDTFDLAQLEKIKDKADRLARKDISQVVYDPQRTNASEALRFVFPFLSAHQDSLARWGGLIAEKPTAVTTIGKIYNAPVAANMITDDQGNVVDMDGNVHKKVPIITTDPETGRAKITGEKTVVEKVTLNERVLHLRNPMLTSNEKGSFPIKLSAMNTILPGDPWFNPGSGPIVQIAGSQIAKASPSVGDFLQQMKVLPYGPSDVTTAIFPKYMRTVYDRWKADDPDGEEFQKAYLAVYNRKVAEYHNGGEKFSPKDVEREAKQFLNLNILEAYFSPAQSQGTPLTGTPYQFYVDTLRQLKEVDPQNANDIFMEKYGEEYFSFTASLNKSMGIASTHSADKMANKYKDILDLDPEMAPFIIGNVYNGGAFSSSVYQKQLEQSFGGEWVREKITAQNAIERTQVEAGWTDYRSAKNELDAMLIRTGMRSYSQSGAEGLNQARKDIIAGIAAKYPGWGEAFMVTDRGKIPNRIQSFERLIQDERFQQDPMRGGEIKSLMEYLQGRREMKAILKQRGASQLSFNVAGEGTGENADLAQMWDQFTTALINQDTQFASTYNRWLSNDHLQ